MIWISTIIPQTKIHAGVVKLVDALDSKSSGLCARVGSIPTFGTNNNKGFSVFAKTLFCCLKNESKHIVSRIFCKIVKKSKHRHQARKNNQHQQFCFWCLTNCRILLFIIESYDPSPAGRFDILIPTNLVLGCYKVYGLCLFLVRFLVWKCNGLWHFHIDCYL